ncbi:MAG: hypothetical protein HYR84_14540 [Planctomycetes bacterium]|nr:hypothetical protein [Planctomycetota bacterium]
MATAESSVSEMLAIVKSRQIQRAIFAEAANDPARAARHFLAAGHLELVLADDYADAGQHDLAFRSRLSAASCLWRGGDVKRARAVFNAMLKQHPGKAKIIKSTIAELDGKKP